MGESKIEWTNTTWNPVRGCSVTSPGCHKCYAMRQAHRFSGPGKPYEGLTKQTSAGPQWTGVVRMAPRHIIEAPIRWRRPRRVFVNSMSDLFHESLSDDDIDRVFGVMWACRYLGRDAYPGHTFQVLTKRAERMRDYMAQDRRRRWAENAVELGGGIDPDLLFESIASATDPHPRIWLGVSVENQETADDRLPHLLAIDAPVRFVSCEPLLGPVQLDVLRVDDFASHDALTGERSYAGRGGSPGRTVEMAARIHWVIAGGESGPGARPTHPYWLRGLRDQCVDAEVPFLFKQWGAWRPSQLAKAQPIGEADQISGKSFRYLDSNDMIRVGKKLAGRRLDGREWTEFPAG